VKDKGDLILKPAVKVERDMPMDMEAGDLADYAESAVYATYDSRLRHLPNARVSSDSLIYRNLMVDKESLYLSKNQSYYQTRHLVKKFLFGKKVTLDRSKNYLLATDQESSGHYHWLTEVLPRLWLIRERAPEFTLLLPDNPYVRTIGLESLDLLGFEFEDIFWMRNDEFLKVSNLFHVTKLARTGYLHDEIMKELRHAFIGEGAAGKRKVYISRADAERRKILNDDDLIRVLLDAGFEIFTRNEMDLKQQVKLFSECGVIAGIHGAGLTNCLFMREGTVVELKKNEPTIAYWHLAGSLGHKYYYYNGVPDSDQSLIGTGCNLTIPITDFENRVLKKIEG
jgi:capsular polysaccharide biosynthesis protein